MVDVPPAVDGAFANVIGPGVAASGFTSITTLCVEGEMNAGRRFACAAPRAGQCIVKLTGALAPNTNAAMETHGRAITGSSLA